MYVHVVLLGKPSGGYRPIALLCSLYRVWAKARLNHVRSWASQLNRGYLALGAGKCTTDVASRVLLQGETQVGAPRYQDDRVALHSIVDIEKCFDRVNWKLIVLAGLRHGFPGQLLCLALEM